jgi:prepilin-type N-terminal cleavage/methylation domain-containing protein
MFYYNRYKDKVKNMFLCKEKRGFTLIELLVAMGLAFLVLLVIYMAYFISQTFFLGGTDTVEEQMYVRTLFSRIADDLQFLSRLNSLTENKDGMEFEIFNRRIIKTDPNTNDKLVEGNVVTYQTKESKNFEGVQFLILQKKIDKYEWWQRFGHSQKPNDNEDPPGYPDDMRDPVYGKQITENGEYEEILEQEYGKEFLMSKISFIPYDNIGQKIESGDDYNTLKMARSMRIEVEYKVRGRYGESLMMRTKVKGASTTIHFINFSILTQEEGQQSGSLSPTPFLSKFFTSLSFFIIR